MKLLLDTHSLIWFFSGHPNLSDTARKLMEDARNQKLISLASVWEMAIKQSKGKLTLSLPLEDYITQKNKLEDFELLSIQLNHLALISTLSFHHNDPLINYLTSLKIMNQPLNYSLKNDQNSFLIQQRLGISQQQLEEVCSTWKITELALFGSILRSDFTPDSDVDILVTFADDAQWGLIDFVRLNQQLETYFNRSVDLLTKRSIENSKNWLRKQEILQTAEVIYTQR